MTDELILIIEDNDDSRLLVRDVLTFNGYRVVEAATAEAGLRLARETCPALILMDIRLPGMDGLAAFRELRRDTATRDIPVIAVTASAMTRDRLEIEEAGFDGYHGKPIDIERLLATIRSMVTPRTTAG